MLLFSKVILANTGDPQASHLASKLSETGAKVGPLPNIKISQLEPLDFLLFR